MSTLYVVATPIGNLEDLTFRALRILKEVDFILCEDTRTTKKLLEHYGIKTQTLSYHQHSRLQKIEYIVQLLERGKNLALVSDAGTPGISDPGNKLISQIVENLENVKIIPIPGASAGITAASISGFPTDKFVFLGFPPAKKKRKKFFEEVLNSKYPVIFYESPYRIVKTLNELGIVVAEARSHLSLRLCSADKELRIVVCRELTKKFETVYRGKIEKVVGEIEKDMIKGEFVVIVKKEEQG